MTDLTRPIVRSIVFDDDGAAVIEYCVPAQDVRDNGVVLNHLLSVPREDQYDDEIDAVTDAVQALLADVLEDFPTMAPFTLPRLDDTDDTDPDDTDDDD
jgi:hypothetical protein